MATTALPHPLAPELRSVSARDLAWLIGSLLLVIAPHTLRAPWWLTLLTLCLYGWRLHYTLQRAPLPSRWLVLGVAAVSLLGLWIEFRTLFGRQPGILLLVMFSGLKLLETRTHRDAAVVAFVAYFLVITNFLYTQSMFTAALMALSLLATTGTLVSLAAPQREPGANLRTAAVLLGQAVPAAIVLFLLFPRVQGPLWGLPQDAYAGMTGLSESMTPGSVAQLAQYDAIAFRAEFEADPPLHAQRYWRGPVLWDFDGRTWHIGPDFRGTPAQPRAGQAQYRYVVLLEAHNRPWLFALETAASIPPNARLTFDGQLHARAPVRTRMRYEMLSVIAPEPSPSEFQNALVRATRLPPGFNPRSLALVAKWRAETSDEIELVRRAVEFLRNGRYVYTLEPPLLGLHTVDEFLFDTRAGFCEHFAAAFTFLMRAAGLPSRVVTGYQGGDLNPYDRIVTVRQWDAHAWSEVFITGRGWVRIDPTAAAFPRRIESGVTLSVPQGSAMPLMMQANMEWLRTVRHRWEAIAHKWNVWVLGYNPERQRDLMQWVGIRDADWRTLTAALFSILGAITLGLLVWSLRRLARPDPVQAAWRRFCAKLARRGVQRAPHEGPRDYTVRAARSMPDARRAILRIGELYIALRYGAESSANRIARLQRLVRALRVT
jgi:transglutaminase-like putative cysteine protease